MSKFCTKCGRPIPEGGICSCQSQLGNSIPENQFGNQNISEKQQFIGQQIPSDQQFMGQQIPPNQQFMGQQIPPNQQFTSQRNNSDAPALVQNLFGRLLNLIKKPVTAGKELIIESNVRVSLLLIAFQGIISALFAMAAAGKVSQYIRAASGLAEGMSSGLGNVVSGALSMPWFRVLLVTVLLSFGLACGLALMLMLGHMILKIPVSFPQMLSAAAIRSAVLVPAILLSIVIFELSIVFGIALFVLVNIWGFTAMILSMSSFINSEEMNMFALMISIVILLFIFITVFVISNTWTLYLPDLIRTALKGMENLSWSQILEGLTGGLY